VVFFLLLTFLLLKKNISIKAIEYIWIILFGIFEISIAVFIISQFIGGWTGMAYGLITIIVFLDTAFAALIFLKMNIITN